MLRQASIADFVDLVKDEIEEIKSGDQGRWKIEFTGFAAARIDVRAFRVVMIPALAIETVCCSCRKYRS
jgi:hypothetical protein